MNKLNITYCILFLHLLFGNSIFSQTNSNELFLGLNYNVNSYSNTAPCDDCGYSLNKGYSFGLNLTNKNNKYWGFDLNLNFYNLNYNFYCFNEFGTTYLKKNISKNYFSLPVSINVYFLKFFSVKSGLIVTYEDGKVDSFNQSGIGTSFGIATKFKLYKRMFFELYPSIKINSIISPYTEKHGRKIITYGIEIRLQYKLNE